MALTLAISVKGRLDVYPDVGAALVGRTLLIPVIVLRSVVRHSTVNSIAQISRTET